MIESDYRDFPFGDFTIGEVFALAREERAVNGDENFVKACMEAIRLNKCADQKSVKTERILGIDNDHCQ